MKAKRRLAAAVGVAISPLVAVCLPAGTASAHGYVSSPPSRQAQCANGVVDCGPIKWEPQSVEGPKGLRSCSGGNERFAGLDDDSKPWKVTPVGHSTQFTWNILAHHSTSSWQYFIDGQEIAEFFDGGAIPGDTVTHTVDFGGFSGKQKVLAVWNIADTANAFYACIDVNIGGTGDGGNPGNPGDPDQCTATAWDSGTAYTSGDTVVFGDHTWRANWWTKGTEPGSAGQYGPWEDLGACAAA